MTDQAVLIVEDEENLLEVLRYNLEREGYRVLTAQDGEQGIEVARQANPDVIILDVMLPRIDGFDVCRILRRETDTPILMLTARGEEVDRVVGLELGADDYVVKPFSIRELMARVKAMLRRPRQTTAPGSVVASPRVLRSGDLELDPSSHIARLGETPLDLKPREFALLELLMTNRGRVLTRDMVLDRLWAQDYIGDSRTVDVHIRWLREKIESDPGDPKRIVTVRGIGYRFEG